MANLSYGETITAVSSAIALIISVVSLVRSGQLEQEQKNLRRITEELNSKQLQRLNAEEAAGLRTRVVVSLEGGTSNWRFRLRNIGASEARNVNLEFLKCSRSPLVPGQATEVLPFKVLQPGTSVSLYAAINLGSPPVFHARVSWQNVDGSPDSAEYPLTV
jgi:hypothetical protein